jgi:6-phosphogluconolactonase
MIRHELIPCSDPMALAVRAAHDWVDEIKAARQAGRQHTVAISGGRIARPFLSEAAGLLRSAALPLDHVHVFWADERCVPPNNPESNYHLARILFLSLLSIPHDNVHRVLGEIDPEMAAAGAEKELRTVARCDAGTPVLDLVVLGMGEDGHVASLFPQGAQTDAEESRVYRAVTGPKPPPRRITMDYTVLSAARAVWVLASGAGKEQALTDSISSGGSTPLAKVIRSREMTRIYTELRPGPV